MAGGHQTDCGARRRGLRARRARARGGGAYRAHLETCAVCRDEVSAFGAVADVLPLGAPPQTPPRALKRRVMATVRAEAHARGAARAARRRQRLVARSRGPALAVAAALAHWPRRRSSSALTLGGRERATRVDPRQHRPRRAPRPACGSPAAAAELVVVEDAGAAAGQGLRGVARRGRTRRRRRPPRCSASPRRARPTSTCPGDLHGVSQVMVTAEPAGGSRVPTHAPVLVARL